MRKRSMLPSPMPCVVWPADRVTLGRTVAGYAKTNLRPLGRFVALGGIKPLGGMFASATKLRSGLCAYR